MSGHFSDFDSAVFSRAHALIHEAIDVQEPDTAEWLREAIAQGGLTFDIEEKHDGTVLFLFGVGASICDGKTHVHYPLLSADSRTVGVWVVDGEMLYVDGEMGEVRMTVRDE